MAQFAVADARRLQHAGARAQHLLAAAFVLEDHPAAGDIDHLERQVVPVPGGRAFLAGDGTDCMRTAAAAGRLRDAEVAVPAECPSAVPTDGAAVGAGPAASTVPPPAVHRHSPTVSSRPSPLPANLPPRVASGCKNN